MADDPTKAGDRPDIGGDPVLAVRLAGSGLAAARLADPEIGLAAAVHIHTGGATAVQLQVEDPAEGDSLLTRLTELAEGDSGSSVTVLSFDGVIAADRWPDSFDEARGHLDAGVRALKAAGTRVIALNVCTVDPEHPTDQVRDQTRTAHELDAALLELSVLEGISVLDVDRVAAEVGAGAHLSGFLGYDDELLERLVAETVYVLGDYGFFETRPLLPQLGTRHR